jgi:hypothetical protein
MVRPLKYFIFNLNYVGYDFCKEWGQLSRYFDGLWAGRLGLESRQRKDFSVFHSIQTGNGAHPASDLCQGEIGMAWRFNQLDPVAKSRIVELYLHSPSLHGTVLKGSIQGELRLNQRYAVHLWCSAYGSAYRTSLFIKFTQFIQSNYSKSKTISVTGREGL